ncbi:MAG: hypothetical protein LBF97_05065 [Elusimicrobiota bacterium]|jgi:uncharacterized protein YqkB|nr:hypothetical protein [Elusimicrobiota bacterium]
MYYDIEKMKEKELCEEYKLYDHSWINIRNPCGCVVAICTDVNVEKKYTEKFEDLTIKNNVIDIYLKQSQDSLFINDEKIIELLKEKRNINEDFRNLLTDLKSIFSLGENIDFNGEKLFIKVIQGEKCTN